MLLVCIRSIKRMKYQVPNFWLSAYANRHFFFWLNATKYEQTQKVHKMRSRLCGMLNRGGTEGSTYLTIQNIPSLSVPVLVSMHKPTWSIYYFFYFLMCLLTL